MSFFILFYFVPFSHSILNEMNRCIGFYILRYLRLVSMCFFQHSASNENFVPSPPKPSLLLFHCDCVQFYFIRMVYRKEYIENDFDVFSTVYNKMQLNIFDVTQMHFSLLSIGIVVFFFFFSVPFMCVCLILDLTVSEEYHILI